jgi:hypothetical protein
LQGSVIRSWRRREDRGSSEGGEQTKQGGEISNVEEEKKQTVDLWRGF